MQTLEELKVQLQAKRKELQELTQAELKEYEQNLRSLVQDSLRQVGRVAAQEARATEQTLRWEMARLRKWTLRWSIVLMVAGFLIGFGMGWVASQNKPPVLKAKAYIYTGQGWKQGEIYIVPERSGEEEQR